MMQTLSMPIQHHDDDAPGCAYLLGSHEPCGAPCHGHSPYCAAHHAICHFRRGSAAERRWLRHLDALADAVGGRAAGSGAVPPDHFLSRLERLTRAFS